MREFLVECVREGENPSGKIRDFATSPYRGGFGGRVHWLPCKGSCQRPEPLTEGFPRGVIQSVPQGHLNYN